MGDLPEVITGSLPLPYRRDEIEEQPDISVPMPARNLIAVEYPGYVQNIVKVLKTLGGEEGVAKAASSRANFLQLRFRPDDPHSHPLFGDQYHTNNLLLKITRHRRRQKKPASLGTELEVRPHGSQLWGGMSSLASTLGSASSLERRANEGSQVEMRGGETIRSNAVSDSAATAVSADSNNQLGTQLANGSGPDFYPGMAGGGSSTKKRAVGREINDDSREGRKGVKDLFRRDYPSERQASSDGNIGDKDEEDVTNITVEVIAKVEATYRFDGLADFQYIPAVHAQSHQKRKRAHKGTEGKDGKDDLRSLDEDEQMSLIPPLFTKADMPQDYIRKVRGLDVASKNQKKKVLHSPPEAVKAAGVICGLDFRTGVIPMKEDPRYVGNILGRKAVMECLESLKAMFRRRPVWSRAMLNECFPEEKHIIVKRLLLRVSYYFGNGPWRMLWIRVGYDPRKEPLSRIYQLLDLRLPPDWVEAGREAVEKNQLRTGTQTQVPQGNADATNLAQKEGGSSATTGPDSAVGMTDPSCANLAEAQAPIYKRSSAGGAGGTSYPRWHDVCALHALPQSRFVFLQLCDIGDSSIQSTIKQKPNRKSCDEHTGWFSRETLDNFRRIVRSRFQKLLPRNVSEKSKSHREWERQQGTLMHQLAPEFYKRGLNKKGATKKGKAQTGASKKGGGGTGGVKQNAGGSQLKTVIDSMDVPLQQQGLQMLTHDGGEGTAGVNTWGGQLLGEGFTGSSQAGDTGSITVNQTLLSRSGADERRAGVTGEGDENQTCGVTGEREEEDTRREGEGEGNEEECLGVGEGAGAEREELEQMRKEMEMAAAEDEEDDIEEDEDDEEEDDEEEDEEEDEEQEDVADPMVTTLGGNEGGSGFRDAQDSIPSNILEVLMKQFPMHRASRSAFDRLGDTTGGDVRAGMDDGIYQIYGDDDNDDDEEEGNNDDEDDCDKSGHGGQTGMQ